MFEMFSVRRYCILCHLYVISKKTTHEVFRNIGFGKMILGNNYLITVAARAKQRLPSSLKNVWTL